MCFELMEEIWAHEDVKPTWLMYRVNLSWRALSELLQHLSDRGLIKSNQVGSRRTISLTELGTSCLLGLHDARALLMPATSEGIVETTSPTKIFPGSLADHSMGNADGRLR